MIYVVLIKVDSTLSRKTCENIENVSYDNLQELFTDIEKTIEVGNYKCFPISDFMDLVNDQMLDDLGGYFISYVTVK